MSERMLELHRQRLMAAGGSGGNAPSTNGSAAATAAPARSAKPQPQLTQQQKAVLSMQRNDELLDRFLRRLQSPAERGSTVPTPLARRMLHRQGAGYLDGAVADLTAAAADRFLATVLQQSVACRDQRLKGAEMERDAARHRKRHAQLYQDSVDDRKRRKELFEKDREAADLAIIQQAEASQKPSDGSTTTKKSKKKKDDSSAGPRTKAKRKLNPDDEDDPYDSLDEEEEYYQKHYGPARRVADNEEDADEMLILKDLSRPLEAWGFHVTGKLGMEPPVHVEEDEAANALEEAELDKLAAEQVMLENGEFGDASVATASGGRKTPTGSNKKDESPKKASKKATSPSATTTSTSKPTPP